MNVATIISDAPSDKLSHVDVVRANSILGVKMAWFSVGMIIANPTRNGKMA